MVPAQGFERTAMDCSRPRIENKVVSRCSAPQVAGSFPGSSHVQCDDCWVNTSKLQPGPPEHLVTGGAPFSNIGVFRAIGEWMYLTRN